MPIVRVSTFCQLLLLLLLSLFLCKQNLINLIYFVLYYLSHVQCFVYSVPFIYNLLLSHCLCITSLVVYHVVCVSRLQWCITLSVYHVSSGVSHCVSRLQWRITLSVYHVASGVSHCLCITSPVVYHVVCVSRLRWWAVWRPRSRLKTDRSPGS